MGPFCIEADKGDKMYIPKISEIFHVHTKRCGHASQDSDEAYVIKAIELSQERIVFTDHAPFPGDPFGSRMKMSEYAGYVESIHSLKEKYKDKIEVFCGLEIEFFEQYLEYYKELKASDDIDVLMLGQHMYMHEDGTYNFMDEDRSCEFEGISRAMVDGINTGLFDVVAHPDRMYMRYPKVDVNVIAAIDRVVKAATQNRVLLEKNYGSMYIENNYNDTFWLRAGLVGIVHGYDAHSVEAIDHIRQCLAESLENRQKE